MNPYAQFVAGVDALTVLPKTADRLRGLVARAGERVNVPEGPGKWSVRDVVVHLADTEIVFAFRLRQALSDDRHVIQPFDQDRWAANSAAYTAEQALELHAAVRSWNVALIRSLPDEAFARVLNHPERGDMTFRTVVETMAGHDGNHIAQIERILGAAAAASV